MTAPAPQPLPIQMRHCFGNYDECPCDDECIISLYCEKYHTDRTNNCGLSDLQCYEVSVEHDTTIRNATLDDVSKRLQKKTYFNGTTWCISNSDIDEALESLRGDGK